MAVSLLVSFIKRPGGPEPAPGTGLLNSEKKPRLSRFASGREQAASKTTKVFAQQARGSRERFFVLRYYYYYVDVTFSFTLR
jgi:hypothetical protein